MTINNERIEVLYSKLDICVAVGQYREAKMILDLIEGLTIIDSCADSLANFGIHPEVPEPAGEIGGDDK